MQPSSGVAYFATVSKAQISPALNTSAPRSWASRTSSHPRAGGPKGLARVTSSRWENSSCTGLGLPLTNSCPARLKRSSTPSRTSTSAIWGSPPLPTPRPFSKDAPLEHPTLFSGVRGRGILRSLHTVSCIENGASKPQGSLLSESTPDDRLIHVVVLSRYARSSMLHCYDGQGAEHTRFLPSFALTAVSAVVSPTPCPYCRRRHGPPQASSESSGRGRAGF